MRWANKEGREGRDINAPGGRAKKAADIGTAAHAMIEAQIHDQDPEAVPELVELTEDGRLRAQRAFGSYLRWATDSRIRIVGTELWGVDEEYKVGYCPDAVAVRGSDLEIQAPIQGKFTPELEEQLIEYARAGHDLSLLDWKTGKGVYAEHVIQVAAYGKLVEKRLTERAGSPITFGTFVILSVKPTGVFAHRDYPAGMQEFEDAWRLFTMLRWAHSKRWEINGLV